MNTTLSFSSRVTKKLMPDTAKIHLCIQTQGKKEDEVLQELKEKLESTSKFIKGLESYRPDSYTQTKFNTRKDTITKKNYTEKIMGYRSWVNLYFSINYGETAVLDLVSVIKMSLDKDFTCDYEFIVDEDRVKRMYDILYVEAVNEGWDNALRLTSKIKPFEGKRLNLVSIDSFRANLESPSRQEYTPPLNIYSEVDAMQILSGDFSKGKGFFNSAKQAETATMPKEEPEKITPELIQEMFNNPYLAVVTVSLQFCVA